MVLILIILANFISSLWSFIGALTLSLKEHHLSKSLLYLIAFSAGALMGDAFIHLLPEASGLVSPTIIYALVLASFILFYLIERVLHWRHCHDEFCEIHTFGYMNLLGDSVHNFLDGLILAATFMTNISLGVTTTFAVALHEIPQELGDFGVLLYSGFTKKKALLLNFLVGLTSVMGGIFGYFLFSQTQLLQAYILPIAAGGFIYIAATDLMPEMKEKGTATESKLYFATFIFGVSVMVIFKLFFPS